MSGAIRTHDARTRRSTRPALGLLLLAPLGCAPSGPEAHAREVEDALAELSLERDGYLGETREEFVVAMRARMDAYRTVLDGVEAADAGSVAELRERVARFAQDVLAVETELDRPWRDRRDALSTEARLLEEDLRNTWNLSRR